MVVGACTLPGSVIAGLLWQYGGPGLPFLFGAVAALTRNYFLRPYTLRGSIAVIGASDSLGMLRHKID